MGCLIDSGVGEQRVEIAIFADQRRRRLDADAGHAGHVVRSVADQRLDVDDLLRRHAEIIDDALAVDAPLRPVAGLAARAGFEIVELDAIADELHQVLVRRDDEHLGAGRARLLGVGGDDVVGLVARLLHRLEAEGAHRLAHQRKLRLQVVGHLAAGALVVGIDLLAEGVLRLVEDDGHVGRHDADRALAHELVELGAEEAERPGRQPVGAVIVFGVLVDRLEKGAIDEGRAIDQEDVVAGAERGKSGIGLRHGATMPRGRGDGEGGERQSPDAVGWVSRRRNPPAQTPKRRNTLRYSALRAMPPIAVLRPSPRKHTANLVDAGFGVSLPDGCYMRRLICWQTLSNQRLGVTPH